MKTLLLTAPEPKAETKTLRRLVPTDFSGWRIKAIPASSLSEADIVPDVTLVQIGDGTSVVEVKNMIPQLAHLQAKAPYRSRVVFSLKEKMNLNPPAARAQ